MKARKLSAGIWAVVMLLSGLGMLGILSVPVVAPPNVHFFSGSITYNGLNAPAGTEVFAEIDGTVYGQDSAFGGTGGYDGSLYSLAVSGEDTANITAKEGGTDGEPIIFWVTVPGEPQPYIANQAPVYTDGNVVTQDLFVQAAGQPIMVRFGKVAPLNASDWVEFYNPSAVSNADLSADWTIEDSYGGFWAFGPGDVLPPLGTSPVPHSVTLLDADSNVKLVWTDPLGTIAGGNPVVMDKVEWGPHIGDTEGSGGDTIGLDKGAGSVWDPNLPNCLPDDGYVRTNPAVDTDTAADWTTCVLPPPQLQPPQLWVPAGGYVTPLTGDTSTMFTYQVWYADRDNHAPMAGSPEVDIYSLSTGPLPGSPFTMLWVSWVGAADDYMYPAGGANYAVQTVLPAGTDWCYVISATDTSGMSNSTAEICDPDVGDSTAPEIIEVELNGAFENVLVNEGDIVNLRAEASDVGYGGSNIAGIEYAFACTWPGNATTPADGAWDEPWENGTFPIDTSFGTEGQTYRVYVRAWDAAGNYNEACMHTANITISVGLDNLPPNILNVLVDGAAQTTVAPGTAVLLTATIDDSATGMSNIGGANYSWDFGPAFAMNAVNPPFGDSMVEEVEVSVDTTGWTNGDHSVCVVDAWDVSNNEYTGVPICVTVTIDGQPPNVGSVALDGVTVAHSVLDGTATVLTATVDDSITGNSNIANASYSIDGGASTAMTAVDLAFDNPVENVEATIDTTGMGGATYTVCVYGADVLGNVFVGVACIQLTVTLHDVDAPDISSVFVDGVPSKQVVVTSTFDITAIVDDTIPVSGPSNVQNASYDVRDSTTSASVANDMMNPANPPFDSSYEPVVVTGIDTTGWALGFYDVDVYACDVVPNCGWSGAAASIEIVDIITDDVPPEISNVVANPDTFNEGGPVTSITLTATADDTNTGNNNIGGANYTIGAANWPGTAMNPVTAPFDNPTEDVTVTIDVSTWTEGTYDVCVYASDSVGNSNLTGECVTVTVDPEIVGEPPVIGTPSITPSSPEEGDEVTISVTVTDAEDPAGNLTVVITIVGPGAVPIVTNAAMTATGDVFSYQTVELTTPGTYTYTITATDTDSNLDIELGTFGVEEVPDDGDGGIDWWIWLLLIIIIIVIVIIIAWAATRRKPEEEIPPEAPLEEEEFPEEEVEEEAFVEEEPIEEVPEEEPPEEIMEEPAPMEEEAPAEEAPAEEAAAGPMTCPNCGTVNPEGISVCTSCGSPL